MEAGIFSPLQIGPLTATGRVFKSATSETRASERGFVTEELLEFYEPIAAAGTPLIFTGNLFVSPEGMSTARMAGIDDDDKLHGLTRWADLFRSNGVLGVAQLNHAGRQIVKVAPGVDRAVSASDVREPLMGTKPRPLNHDELPRIVEEFAAAAYRAAEAGFDGVQIHCAHGYLLSEFLTPHTNRRRDEYGGSLENRMRLSLEVLRAVKRRVGDSIAVIAKINGTDALSLRRGATTKELVRVAVAMQEEGLDAVEISRGHYASGASMIQGHFHGFLTAMVREGGGQQLSAWRRRGALAVAPVVECAMERLWPPQEGFNLPEAEQFTAALDIPVICVGGFQGRPMMDAAIANGLCDAVSVARAMIAEPELYAHLREPDPLTDSCGFCNGCIARAGGSPVACYSRTARTAATGARRKVPA
jgi:2,4-dienoyl-CoA reductase-like NADH-dependent reductase (Old Yellow Enzyme family)